MGRWDREPKWWKTFDYLTGKTYILAEKFTGKMEAMKFAEGCGMRVIGQSTVAITDEQREIAILKNELKAQEA